MSSWAYPCRPVAEDVPGPLFVACVAIDPMPAGNSIVRIKVGPEWHCALVDRSQRVAVEGMLLHDVIASDEADCPECSDPVGAESKASTAEASPDQADKPSGRQVQAAAMAMQGRRLVVVLVSLDLIKRPGEADMAIADLRPRFGGADVVLMGQQEDGTPNYHGEAALLELLSAVPLDQMPWKEYPIG